MARRFDPDSFPIVAVLRDQFDFVFSSDHRLEPLEDYLISRALLWSYAVAKLRKTIINTREELHYLDVSLDDPKRVTPYIPIGGFRSPHPEEAKIVDAYAEEIKALCYRLTEAAELLRASDEIVRATIQATADAGAAEVELWRAAAVDVYNGDSAALRALMMPDAPTEAPDA
jgi:hypothetical protein